jgi:hypothetical protein
MTQTLGEGSTIRKIVSSIRNEIRTSDLEPNRAAELKTKLSAIHGNVLSEIRRTESEYNRIYLNALKSEEKANRAKIISETSPEYLAFREAKDTKEEVLKMMSSLGSYLRLKEEEMRFTPR